MASIPTNAAYYQGHLHDNKHVLQGCQVSELHIGGESLMG
jgi:hypothetical protein